MAKKERPPITVKAFVKVNGVETDVDTLTPEQRKRLATELNVTMMNELYAGVAHFFPAKQSGRPGTFLTPRSTAEVGT